MGKYKGNKPKVYELAKEMEMNTKELLELCAKIGLPYRGVSSLVEETPDEFKVLIQRGLEAGSNEELEKARERGVNLVGMYFNPDDRKYYVAEIKLSKNEFDRLGGKLDRGNGTVYIAKPKLGAKLESSGILRPSKFAKEKL